MFPSPVGSRDEGKVYRLATGSSGRLLAIVMDTLDGEVRLFDAPSLGPRGKLLLGAMRSVRACAVGAGDAALAVLTQDDATLFRVGTGRIAWTTPLVGDEPAVAFSVDGLRLAVGAAPDAVQVLSTADGRLLATTSLEGGEPVALVWDRAGLVALGGAEPYLVLLDEALAVRTKVLVGPEGAAPQDLVAVGERALAIAGNSADGPWLELRARGDGALMQTLSLEGDRQAEGLAFAGGVLFVATEGGTYRADPPYEQLVRWLPPLGGTHDPTRLAAVADAHIAVSARDVRIFRTRS